MREHHSFRLAGRAGSVNDGRQIFGSRPRGECGVKLWLTRVLFRTERFERGEAQHIFVARGLEENQLRRGRLALFERRLNAPQLFMRRNEKKARAAVTQNVADLLD